MKKLNREVVAIHASRFFLVLMSFMLILSLCSATAPSASVPVNIQNPDNIPNDLSFIFYPDMDIDNGIDLSFGVNSLQSQVVTVIDGLIGGEIPIDIPDGSYLFLMIFVGQPEGYSADVSFNGNPFTFNDIQAYYTDNPTITVVERESTGVVLTGGLFIVPVPPSPSNSLTSVWTSISNWVISSLNTVQGVFYGSGEEVITPDTSSSDTVVYNGVTYYPFAFASAEEAGGGRVYLNGVEIFEDGFGQTVTTINGQQFVVVSNGGVDILLLNTTNEFTYAPVGLEIVITSDGSLTLLGTLAVIGLSISLVFLVIGVIQRFLKLRG